MTFVGNATTVLRLGHFTLLTDPAFGAAGSRVYLGYGAWSRRIKDPALAAEELPPLDAVLLSHLARDHFDRAARDWLPATMPILTTPQAQRRLQRRDFVAVRGLPDLGVHEWDRDRQRLRVTRGAGPARAGAGRPPAAGRHGIHCGAGTGRPLPASPVHHRRHAVSGRISQEIPRRFGEIDAMLIHLGGTRLLGVLLSWDGRQGVETTH
jgi:L-ascorbate metabolism protein UlaG (beta-lactamase superfamily)